MSAYGAVRTYTALFFTATSWSPTVGNSADYTAPHQTGRASLNLGLCCDRTFYRLRGPCPTPPLYSRKNLKNKPGRSERSFRVRSDQCTRPANILNKLPKSLHTKAKRALQEIWMAETKKDAVAALEAPVQARGRLFVETYGVKYDKAADCLTKDRDALLAFYDFPAEHWKHLPTTNPIESTFATVRHRTVRSKGCLSNKTALAMVFKLVEGAQKTWRRIDGHNQLPKLILGVKFADGIEVIGTSAAPQAAA